MKLSELLRGVEVAGDVPAELDITAITADSRQVEKGSLFVAVPGYVVDGAKFIDSAVQKGAAAIIHEGGVSAASRPRGGGNEGKTDAPRGAQGRPEADAPRILVRDARTALAIIAANFHGRPAEKLSLIGVTGTSGKTTTTKMVESVLDATGEPAGLIGTIEYRAGDLRQVADRTTPDSVVLQEWFAKMVECGVTRAVMEVSSHALALRRTWGVPFAAAVFTNLSREHFEFHKDFEDYFGAKRMLFDQIDRSRRTAVVNRDDEWGMRLVRELGPAVMTFGRDSDADIHPGEGFRIDIDGLHGTVNTPAGPVRLDSPLLGLPNLYNWLGAIGASLVVELPRDVIERGIAALGSVRGRFERVPSDDAVVLVDYAHKPDALEKLLRAVRELAPDRRILLVFGCGGDRDKGKRPLMGRIAGELADESILTSDNPRTEDPDAILDAVEDGIREVSGATYRRNADRRSAIAEAVAAADERTVVVIAGKGHENYQVIGDQIVHFDDREEAELALRKKHTKNRT